MDRILQVLQELHAAARGRFPLVIAGGLGLYLKQRHLLRSPVPTLFPREQWPIPRTTEDIDLLLHAEMVTDSSQMGALREMLDELGFVPIESARYYQFVRGRGPAGVKIDLLTGPLGAYESRVPRDPRRVRPRPSVRLHARRTPEAIGVEEETEALILGEDEHFEVRLPNALTLAVMKLAALHDRSADPRKDLGRHHALDLYRCVAMLTPEEDQGASRLRQRYARHPSLATARRQVATLFGPIAGVGRLRLREHELLPANAEVDRFVEELKRLMEGV